jgi:hypothetical protein
LHIALANISAHANYWCCGFFIALTLAQPFTSALNSIEVTLRHSRNCASWIKSGITRDSLFSYLAAAAEFILIGFWLVFYIVLTQILQFFSLFECSCVQRGLEMIKIIFF